MGADRLRFGTDGVRGRVGVDLDERDVEHLGVAVARQWPDVRIVVGHDGRESGPALLAAFARGVQSEGNLVVNAGLVPTPALAYAAKARGCVAVAITASHNPWHDNGVKVFAPGGSKLSDETQQRIEALWHSGEWSEAASGDGATIRAGVNDAPSESNEVVDEYIAGMTSTLGVAPFGNAKIVVDCANGATSSVVRRITQLLGLDAEIRNDAPNGRNINEGCGASHPDALASTCSQRGVVGIAFDGDGDRLIAVDELGQVVDGDRLIALSALDMRRRGVLAHDTVVVTSMTNLGFHRAMREQHIATITTDVGDRAVLAAMEDGGFVLGGEQSGHIINARYSTTGDGVLSAILLLDLIRRSESTLSKLSASVMTRMPQVLRNVRVAKKPIDVASLIADDLAREHALLGDSGRIVVRTSGTEPLVRIMVEAESQTLADGVAARLEQAVIART